MLAVGLVVIAGGADWRQFRGNDSSGVAADARPPVVWGDTENVAWKVKLDGRGLSGPIIVGDRVFLTSCTGFRQDRLQVLCFDSRTGRQRWKRTFWATGRTQCHAKMCVATPTPASDGKSIVAFYSTNDLVCLDLDGNLLWFRGLTHDYPNASNSLGMASSPVIAGDTVVVQVENHSDSFAAGIDIASGATRWRIDRTRFDNWTSPIVLKTKRPGHDLVLMQNSTGLTAVEPRTGRVVWSYDQETARTPSAVIDRGTVFVPSKGITALKPADGKNAPAVLWQENRLGPSTPSLLVYERRLYSITGAILKCADPATGKLLWQVRLEGPITSSPVAAGGHLYVFNEKGQAQVVKLGEKGEVVARNDLGETILCTPAIAHQAIFVRSDGHLWKIAR